MSAMPRQSGAELRVEPGTLKTRWGCTSHTENAVCYACAGPDEGPQWWRQFRDFGMLYSERMRYVYPVKFAREMLVNTGEKVR